MTDFKLEACKDKLRAVTKAEALRVIYMWVKQSHINISQFRSLIDFIE